MSGASERRPAPSGPLISRLAGSVHSNVIQPLQRAVCDLQAARLKQQENALGKLLEEPPGVGADHFSHPGYSQDQMAQLLALLKNQPGSLQASAMCTAIEQIQRSARQLFEDNQAPAAIERRQAARKQIGALLSDHVEGLRLLPAEDQMDFLHALSGGNGPAWNARVNCLSLYPSDQIDPLLAIEEKWPDAVRIRQSEKYTQVVDALLKHLPFDVQQSPQVEAQVNRLAEQARLYREPSDQV